MKKVEDYKNLPGRGLRARIADKEIKIVSPGYLHTENISYDEGTYKKLAQEGKTIVFILENHTLLGYIALSDMVRETAKEAVYTLKCMDIQSIMLTGDNERAASYIGYELKIDKIFAEVMPQEKSVIIDDLIKHGNKVAMTCDGVDDAPLLAKADLGIAIGTGTDVAIETAEVILVKSNPFDVVNIIGLSRATYKKMLQNLIWATGYNVIALPLAAGILFNKGIVISPALGAILMSLSTIIVSINAKFLNID